MCSLSSCCCLFCADEDLECFCHYCASLFAVPATGNIELQTAALETCLTIEVLDEVRSVLGPKETTNSVSPPSHVYHSLFLQKFPEDFVAAQRRNASKTKKSFS